MTGTPSRLTSALADRYRLERELGQGGMATVYLAHDLRHDRDVAIKVLHADLGAALGPERFLSEIKTTARLQHPHILPLLDSGNADGLLYYVMPLVTGETLRARLDRERQLPVDDAVRIAREVADALGYAHGLGVIHRDIKPENILLQGGHALVADFGIALAVQQAGGARMTQTGLSLGTPQYMSPEQAMGEKTIDARSDIYALGAVTYEMLVGEPPFTGPSVQAIVARLVTEEPRAIATQRKAVSPVVEAAVLHALEKLPADRFATAAEFAAALTAPPSRPAVQPSSHGAAAASRARGKSVLLHPLTWVLTLLALAASAFGFREWSARGHAAPASVVRFFMDLPPGYRPQLTNSNNGPDFAISPDGSMLAFPVTDPQGARMLFVRPMNQAEGHVLPGTDEGYGPGFSTDGATLTFWAAGRIQRVALAGGAPRVIAEPGLFWSIAPLTDGDILAVLSGGTHFVRFSASDGTAHATAALDTARDEVSQFFPVALPDGNHVLYASWGRGGVEDVRIGLLDLSSRVARRLDVQGTYPLGMLDGRLVYTDQAGSILAIPLDLATGQATGQPVTLVNGVVLAARGSAVAALSPSGTLVYLGGDQVSTLVLANASGEKPLPVAAGLYGYPRYSPDGQRIAMTVSAGTAADIWIADVASGVRTRLTSGGSVNERPEWSPDGRRVLFRTVRGARSALWWQPADGSGPATPLLTSDSANYFEGAMTPDGQHVVYQVDQGQSDVMMQRVNGDGTPVVIANSQAAESQARVSPDGKWVVYVSGEGGTPQIIVQPLAGDGSKVQISIRGGSEPVWSRDGRRIFYRAEGKFKVADVSYATTFHVTASSDFMDGTYLPSGAPHANYDVSPDGKTLLVLKGEPQRLQVVVNWGAEVRGKLREGNGPR